MRVQFDIVIYQVTTQYGSQTELKTAPYSVETA
jgi:hypothetical protein